MIMVEVDDVPLVMGEQEVRRGSRAGVAAVAKGVKSAMETGLKV